MVACRPPGTTTIPPTCTTSCVERPRCSFQSAWDDAGDPLQAQLGCGPVFQYRNGANSGILGGTGSFCTDSPANRQVLHDAHKRGYPPGYCETCLGVPAGKVFVFWTEAIGPSCPSGCVVGDAAPPF